MPFVIIGGERFALPIGETRVGGSGDDALPDPTLAVHPTTAMISVLPDRVATAWRVGDAEVLLDGAPLGSRPVTLTHGSRLEVAGVRILFGDIGQHGTTAHVSGVTDRELALLGGAGPSQPTADSGGRLVLADGRVVAVPDGGLTIGREPGCDLVLTGKGVSRRHATIKPSLQGYRLSDESSNGTLVNGRRVDGAQVLGLGDAIRIGDEELRFEADPASYEPAPGPRSPGDDAPPASARPPGAAAAPPPATLFATLEVVNEGPLKGTRFRIERPVAHVGRGEHNDVRLRDASVSGSHATLTRRATGWVVLDLGSTNGTYLDGERVAGERALGGAAELRFGNLKLLFRPIAGGAAAEESTRALLGVRDQ